MKLSDKDLIIQIKDRDFSTIEIMYKNYFPKALNQILNMGGQYEDAQDIMQMAMVSLISNVTDGKFESNSKLSTYFMGIVKNMWLQEFKKKTKVISFDKQSVETMEQTSNQENQNEDIDTIINTAILNLKPDCHTLLKSFYFEKKRLKTIAENMGLKESFIRVKKDRCMKSLKQVLLNNPLIKEKYSYALS